MAPEPSCFLLELLIEANQLTHAKVFSAKIVLEKNISMKIFQQVQGHPTEIMRFRPLLWSVYYISTFQIGFMKLVCKGQVDTGSMHALIETCGECLVLSSTQIVVTAGASSWYELKRAQWEAALHIKAHIWYPYVAET